MPIKPENRARYPADWKMIRAAILERAGDQCEQCTAPNGMLICRGGNGTYMLEDGEVRDEDTGKYLGFAKGSEYPGQKFVKVVLTIAHLDHTPENCDPSNLRALCQLHHLRYDAEHHRKNAAETRRSRKAIGDLFAA
jgi:glyoxylase-like metal-dependent hydrolase (beta-lactamase superfamily II)